MLGDIVVEEVGTVTKKTELGDNKVEVDLTANGQIKGVDQTSEWTYWVETRPDGSLYSEGHGVMTTTDGDVLNLRGMGACPGARADGSVSWRGSILIHTDSEAFADLNGTALVFHYEVQADGGTHIPVIAMNRSGTRTAWAWN